MEAGKRDELRRWARRLSAASGPQSKAAGRAIVLLVDEVERLEAQLAGALDELQARERAERERAHATAERATRRDQRERRRRDPTSMLVAAPAGPSEAPERLPEPEELTATLEPDGDELSVPDIFPAELLEPPRPPRRRPPPRRRRAPRMPPLPRPGRRTFVAAGVAALAVAGTGAAARVMAPDLTAGGPAADALIGAAAAENLLFSVAGDEETLAKLRWTVNGEDVTDRASIAAGRSMLPGSDLPDGGHEILAFVDGRLPLTSARLAWHISLDRVPPEVEIDPETAKGTPGRPLTLKGSVEPGATLKADGTDVEVVDGLFELSLPEPPAGPIALLATDRHGNAATTEVAIELVPRPPPAPIRSVHVTFWGWANDELRGGIIRLIDEGRINSVQLDLKDESGLVGFDADVPFAREIGAIEKIYDLEEAIDVLHAKGVYVIGRIVAFRDPIHAQAAWRRGWRNQVVQTPDGGLYGGYGGFTNFAHPVVRQYNIDVARVAVEAGVDDILYDYVRRPDGPTSTMAFPGLQGTAEESVASFLGEARKELKPYDVFLGASVFGVAATRPHEAAQDIPAMARHVDYIAPMLYPSHWGPGEYDVANPNAQPYDITFRSLSDFEEQTTGTGARVVPWLQDFSMGVTYGPDEVRAQIRAAADVGIDEWILWDPHVTYTADALDRHPLPSPIETRRGRPPQQEDDPPPAAGESSEAAPASRGAAAASPSPEAVAAARAVNANELGVIPVVMYHQIRADGGGDYDLTPAEFRAELARLHREGYAPIRAVDLATGTIDVPAGKTPVVMTFDDSTKEQLYWDADKRPLPDTAIGIMLDFARRFPGFRPAGTFYVNRDPFAGAPEGAEMLRWLHENGFELGNHTHDHLPFGAMSAQEVQRQLALGRKLITDSVPDASVRTVSLPLGVMPDPPELARKGSWNGISYEHAGVFLVGAEPAPSPFSQAFRPGAIPRIRTSPPGARDGDYGSTFWLDDLAKNPGRRYVSDGDPKTISFPKERAGDLAPRFRQRANPY
jgi:hypothetical protein